MFTFYYRKCALNWESNRIKQRALNWELALTRIPGSHISPFGFSIRLILKNPVHRCQSHHFYTVIRIVTSRRISESTPAQDTDVIVITSAQIVLPRDASCLSTSSCILVYIFGIYMFTFYYRKCALSWEFNLIKRAHLIPK